MRSNGFGLAFMMQFIRSIGFKFDKNFVSIKDHGDLRCL